MGADYVIAVGFNWGCSRHCWRGTFSFVLGFVAYLVAIPFFLGWAKAREVAENFL